MDLIDVHIQILQAADKGPEVLFNPGEFGMFHVCLSVG